MVTQTPSPKDADARARALTPDQSFIVTAPAGSGKTGLLTQRALLLLSTSQHPEDVLCITFTRKAAAEMRQRILQALQSATKKKPHNPHDLKTWELARAVLEQDKKENWQLMQNPSRLRLQTIDGLCRNLSQQLPLASGLGADLDPLENPKATYENAINQFLVGLEDEKNPLHPAIKSLLYRCDNNTQRLESLLIQMLTTRDQWLPLLLPVIKAPDQSRQLLERYLKKNVESSLHLCHQVLLPFGSEIGIVLDQAATELNECDPSNPIVAALGITGLPTANVEEMPQWLAIAELLLTKDGKKYRSAWNKNIGFSPGKTKDEKAIVKQRKASASQLVAQLQEAGDDLRQHIHALRQLPPITYNDSDWTFLDDLTKVLLNLTAHLQIIFGQQGATDFVEVNQAAISALSTEDDEASELLLQLDYRIQHILVDEFQDTSWPQLRLLEQLTAGWQADEGRTLFLVGDGMQSCYGFRGANVGIFLQVRESGVGNIPLEPLKLTVNFRSRFGVVDWVNQQFSKAFPQRDDTAKGAVQFQLADAFDSLGTNATSTNVECTGFINDETRVQEAQWVAKAVNRLRKEKPNESVAILVRTRSHLHPLLNELRNLNLQGQATDIEPLSQRMAIIDVLNLTQAMLNPTNELAWFSLFRAPWCGLDNNDLLHLRNYLDQQETPLLASQWLLGLNWDNKNVQPIALELFEEPNLAENPFISNANSALTAAKQHQWPLHLSESAKASLESLAKVLQAAWLTRQRKNLRRWIEGIWIALGSSSHLLEASDLRNIHTFFDLLEKHSQQGQSLDWPNFNEAMGRLYAAPTEDADPNLQIMTLHKSKGLEFDHVFIIGLDRASRGDDKALLLWQDALAQDGEHALILAPLAQVGHKDSPVYTYLQKEKAHRQQLEATRLLYVGCTRAIRQLYLTAGIKTKDDASKTIDELSPEYMTPKSQSLLSSIWPDFKAQMTAIHMTKVLNNTAHPIEHAEDSDVNAIRWSHIRKTISPRPTISHLHQPVLSRYRGTCLSLNASVERESEMASAWASSSITFPVNNANQPDNISHEQFESRIFGTLLHWVLEKVAEEGWKKWPESRVLALTPILHTKCLESGVSSPNIEKMANNIIETTFKMLSSSTGKWILHQHRESACEWAILDTKHERLYVIDRTFVDEEGTRWIIDYKSSQPEKTQSIESFIQKEIKEYKNQLNTYARLIYQKDRKPVKKALYFPLLDKLVDL